jgi:hypothetical protein
MSAIQRLAFRLVVSAIPLLSGTAIAGDTQLQRTPIGIGAKVGFGSLTYHSTCVWFRVLFISGDFFEGFKEHKTVNGLEFRRRKEKTVYFPDQLLVELEAFSREVRPGDNATGLCSWASGESLF